MNIYLHELRACRKSVLIWTASLSLVVTFYLSLYPAFAQDTMIINAVFSKMPQTVMDALGFSPEVFTNVLGFYTFTMMYIILCGAIQAMNLGMGVLAKEAALKTADFLLTKPISRAVILTAKSLACLTALFFTSAVFIAVAGIVASSVTQTPFDWWMFIKLSLPLFFVQLIFAAIGFFIAAVARKIKSVLPLSLSTVFAFFIIGLVQGALKYQDLRYITPFKYFEYGYILKNASYEGVYVMLSALIVVVAVALSYATYLNKDIHAA